MKLTINNSTKTVVNVSPETMMAIEAYRKMRWAEDKMLKAENNLNEWVLQVPQEEMEAYIQYTTCMEI